MTKARLTYFDAPVSRGEECRLALHLAGVDFEDHRLTREQWAAVKPTTPFGSAPVLDWPGKPALAQSNAILTFVGRRYDLHPKDDFEAARHEAMMGHVEDLPRGDHPTMRMTDEAEKKRAREQLSATYIPAWAAYAERQIDADGPFFGGATVQVVDFKILMIVRWLKSGALDHVPGTVLDGAPRLHRVHDAVDAHPRVRDWYEKRG
ncbi:MAG: glutathione S-transferase family protein [Myxococcales bacterium]|nr:glutathione S-transferase family protein [Myxococcales bacterium]